MISIAVCDDEAAFADALHSLIDAGMRELSYGENPAENTDNSYNVTVFNDPLKLLAALDTEQFNLVFLDLLMAEESGFGIAERIRLRREDTAIVFVTSYSEGRNESFRYGPIGYIEKPAKAEAVTEILRLYISWYSDCERYIYVGRRNEERRLNVSDIVYIEVQRRDINIKLVSGEQLEETGRLSAYEEMLQGSGFVRCYRSIIVNPRQIKAYNTGTSQFIMNNGDKIPVSRNYTQQAIAAYNRARNGGM